MEQLFVEIGERPLRLRGLCNDQRYIRGPRLFTKFQTRDKANNIKKTTNNVLASCIEIISTPVNPNNPAIMAKIKKAKTNCIIVSPYKYVREIYS